jgi:hypothetical protein
MAQRHSDLATTLRRESMADFDAATIAAPAKTLPRLADKSDSRYNGFP